MNKRKLTKAQFKQKEERLEKKKELDERQQKIPMDVDVIPIIFSTNLYSVLVLLPLLSNTFTIIVEVSISEFGKINL